MAGFGALARLVCFAALSLGISIPAFAAGNAYQTYSFNGPNTIDITNCGSTGTVQGCFSGVSLSGLEGACSIIEGVPTTSGNRTIQRLFILQTGSDANPVVTLKVFMKTVTIQPNAIVLTATLQRSVTIRTLHGGSKLTCSMAANANSIFLGTSAGTHAVQLDRATFAGTPFGQGLPPSRLSSITAGNDGNVLVLFGNPNPHYYLFGPDGKNLTLGGAVGTEFIPNRLNGVKLK